MDLSNLAASIVSRRCALFAGAGLTAGSGGSTWPKLVKFLKGKFSYSSPLLDEFEVMGDICDKAGRKVIYNAVAERLKDARLDESLAELVSLPWFTAFTTNYDTALESALNKNQRFRIRTVCTGREFVLTGLQSEMLCVKLMGSLDIADGQPGAMVLDSGDLTIAREERSSIFSMLESHAANLSFLFIGYSFDDKIFFEILQKIIKTIGKPSNTFYAVFLKEPDNEKKYLLEQYNVKIIVSDLKSFASEIAKQVALRDPKDYTAKRIPIGSDIVPIDSTKNGDFLASYGPVFFEDLEEEVSASSFLKGQTNSFKPFSQNWHFPRKEIKTIIKESLLKKNRVVNVEGNLGSGRTFAILASVHTLIFKHRSLAIKIPSYSFNKIPAYEHLEAFMEEVERAADGIGVKHPERIVFWAEFPLEKDEIAQFINLALEFKKYPIVLISEAVTSALTAEDWIPEDKVYSIVLEDTLETSEKEQLIKYVVETCRTHKLPELTEDEARQITAEEKSFLSIIYRAMDEARRSINTIIQEEYSKLEPVTKTCISLCAIASSIDIPMPVAVLRKALSKSISKELTFKETFDIALENAKAFIRQFIDHRTNYYFSIYNPLIAQQLNTSIGAEAVNGLGEKIAQTVDIRSWVEAEFAGHLLINKGVNWSGPMALRPFNNVGLKRALNELMVRQPARPIIHHLARLYYKIDRQDERVVPLLEKALVEPMDYYVLEERKENVLTTLARVKWQQNREKLLSCDRRDAEIESIILLLKMARTRVSQNIHSYDLHGRILKELAHEKSDSEKMELLEEAVDVIQKGLDLSVGNNQNQERLKELLIEVASEINPAVAEGFAGKLLIEKNDGTGYYILAIKEYHEHLNEGKAREFLDKAIGAEKCPAGAIVLKIELELQRKPPDYFLLSGLVEDLSASGYEDNWKSAYYKGVVYTIVGSHYGEAVRHFRISSRLMPYHLQRKVQLFWEDKGHRKVLIGKIERTLTEREGRIYSHPIEGWKDDIFFDPRMQENKEDLKPGLAVNFELGFSPRGPIAFDVRPYKP